MFETYDDFTDELQLVFSNVMDDNEPEDLDSAVEAVIESDAFDDCREYFLACSNTEEDWEEMLVQMCEDYV